MPVKVVSLYAGAGGLDEGFSSFNEGRTFEQMLVLESHGPNCDTLRLRTFFHLIRGNKRALDDYYDFCNGVAGTPFSIYSASAWEDAGKVARMLTCGDPSHNGIIDAILDTGLRREDRWVLIGQPEGQLYRSAGISRSSLGSTPGNPEEIKRHFLFEDYLRLIWERCPPVFLIQQPVGILRSQYGEAAPIEYLLSDLVNPGLSAEKPRRTVRYRLCSLTADTCLEYGMDPQEVNGEDFVCKSEKFGIPYAVNSDLKLIQFFSDHRFKTDTPLF